MNALVVTVAGTSSRFEASLGNPALKCIYYEGDEQNTLIYRMLTFSKYFDFVVVVGGYRFEELESYIDTTIDPQTAEKILLVRNDRYRDAGSGWSLYLGLQALRDKDVDSIVFAEGDLFLDSPTFDELCQLRGDFITTSNAPVEADKSVALYYDCDGVVHYIYDTAHGALKIDEPFLSIWSSGQVWGFGNAAKLWSAVDSLSKEAHEGTNLALVNEYFSNAEGSTVRRFTFNTWVNCNTVQDYRRAITIGD